MESKRKPEKPSGKWDRAAANDAARGARLSAAMVASGLTYNCQLCYDLGVTESSLSRWRSGGPMSASMAVGLAQLLDVSLDWLITGRVGAGKIDADDDSGFNEVMSLFAALSPGDRKLVLELSDALVQQQTRRALPAGE